MSDSGMDEATSAFEQVLNPKPAPARRSEKNEDEAPVERMFARVGDLDEDSDIAGGDDLPIKGVEDQGEGEEEVDGEEEANEEGLSPEEIAAAKKAAKKPNAEEDEDEEDDEEDSDEFLDQEVEVTVDGKPQTVKLGEAINGYIRTETFHTRLNQLSEAKTILQTEAAAIIEGKKTIATKLKEVEDTLSTLLPKEPDWDALFAEDPAKARGLQKQYNDVKAKIEETKAERAKIEKEAAEAQAVETAKYRDTEFRHFVAKNPDIKDKKTMDAETQSMRRTAFALGFSEEELAETYDHRMLTVLRWASKYQRMMASKPKAVKPSAIRPNASGSRPAKPDAQQRRGQRQAPKGLANAQQRLARNGSVDAAADVFSHLIK